MKIKYDAEGWTIVDTEGKTYHVPPQGLLALYGETLIGAIFGHTETCVVEGFLVPHSKVLSLGLEMEQARSLFENKDVN